MDTKSFDTLTTQLSQLATSANTQIAPWERVLVATNDLWHAYTYHLSSIWPPSLRPQRSSPARWPRFLRLWRSQSVTLSPLLLASPAGQPRDTLQETLSNCYAALNSQVRQHITPWFSPYYTELPIELSLVSERGVIWALYLWALPQQKTTKTFQQPLLPVTKYPIDVQQQPTDAICVHVLLEELLQSAPWQPNKRLPPLPAVYHPGGLRTESFLRTCVGLTSPKATPAQHVWRSLVTQLMNGSPLTQLIYMDWATGNRLPDACAGVVAMPLPATTDQEQEQSAVWRDLWYTQLARSLLGALLSEPPAWVELQYTEQHLQFFEVRLSRLQQEQEHQGNTLYRYSKGRKELETQISKLRSQCQALRRQRAAQLASRLERLSSLFQDAQGNRRCSYLQVRLLDMLMRHMVTLAMPAMLDEWQLPTQKDRRVRSALFNEEGACFNTFVATLFGHPSPETFHPLLSADQISAVRHSLEILLDPPTPENLLQWATAAQVPEDAARRLWAHFSYEPPIGGIPLPLTTDSKAPSPQSLLSDWLPFLLNRLPSVRITETAQGEDSRESDD